MKMGSPLPHRKARIEIIPLIDIMFFLLAAFMMVSLSMIHMQVIKVNLPTATKATQESKPDIVNIAVDKKGDMFIDKTPIKANDLLVELLKKYRANTNIPVYISGDREASHGAVINVLDLVRKAGIQKVAFAINRAEDAK
ncbi:MAG TPA: biopolymer transporter ExbD [Candidatus Limnocylindria bacterium]|jgi:biopolymer transport protein ExbD|nr:biopolymer transporter ExbD [Candidatus Limnocylindria bacterium]